MGSFMNFTRKRNYRTSTVGQRKNPKLRPAKTAPRQNLKIQRPEKKDFVANDRQRILTPWNLDQHFREHNEKSSIQPRIGRRLLQKEKINWRMCDCEKGFNDPETVRRANDLTPIGERENAAIPFEKNPLAATCDEGTFRPARENEKKKISTHRKRKGQI